MDALPNVEGWGSFVGRYMELFRTVVEGTDPNILLDVGNCLMLVSTMMVVVNFYESYILKFVCNQLVVEGSQ